MNIPKEIVDLIQTVGFPIVVAGYLLWKYDRHLGQLVKLFTVMNERMGTQNEISRQFATLLQENNTNIKVVMSKQL